jgi:hypothetical protein
VVLPFPDSLLPKRAQSQRLLAPEPERMEPFSRIPYEAGRNSKEFTVVGALRLGL